MQAGESLKQFFNATYPRRRNIFLLVANLATLFGAIKEIFISLVVFFMYLKVRLGEFKNLPSLKILSTALVFALFFLGSIRERLDRQFLSALLASSF